MSYITWQHCFAFISKTFVNIYAALKIPNGLKYTNYYIQGNVNHDQSSSNAYE